MGQFGSIIPGLAIPEHDHVTLDPPTLPTTITYRAGGAMGDIVAVLTLTYVAFDLETISIFRGDPTAQP